MTHLRIRHEVVIAAEHAGQHGVGDLGEDDARDVERALAADDETHDVSVTLHDGRVCAGRLRPLD